MYKRILVPMDGSPLSDRVLPYVKLLGKGLGARVELYRVYDPEPEFFWPQPQEYLERHEAAVAHRREAEAALDAAKDELASTGVTATAVLHGPEQGTEVGQSARIFFGPPAEHIVQKAEEEDPTLIVMSTHGRAGVGRWALGSVTDKVLHATKCALMILRAGGEEPPPSGAKIGSVIVTLDGSELAETVLPHATAVAKALDAKMRLVRVTPADFEDADVRDSLSRISERLKGEGIADVSTEVLHGDPAGAIVDLTHRTPDAMVAITTHGRSGVGRWMMGSVADRVVKYGAVPVLVLRGA